MDLTKIMVFGTFDILHKGHLNFFKQAKKLSKNPFLIVSVARDVNVKRIKNHKPLNTERQRKSEIEKLDFVDKVVLGDRTGYLKHIIKESPQIIALGYDQVEYVNRLIEDIKKYGLKIKVRRLKSFFPSKYKTSLLKKSLILQKL